MHTWTEQSTPRDTESSFIDSVRWNRHTTALCPYYELAAYCSLLVLASHHVLKTYQCSAQAVQHRPRGVRACLVGLFGRPGFGTLPNKEEGHWGGKGIEFDC
jgi:hypothetical protein